MLNADVANRIKSKMSSNSVSISFSLFTFLISKINNMYNSH